MSVIKSEISKDKATKSQTYSFKVDDETFVRALKRQAAGTTAQRRTESLYFIITIL